MMLSDASAKGEYAGGPSLFDPPTRQIPVKTVSQPAYDPGIDDEDDGPAATTAVKTPPAKAGGEPAVVKPVTKPAKQTATGSQRAERTRHPMPKTSRAKGASRDPSPSQGEGRVGVGRPRF